MRTRRAGVLLVVVIATFSQTMEAGEVAGSDRNNQPGASPDVAEAFRPPLASVMEPASLFRYVGDAQMDFGLTQPFALYTREGKGSTWQVGIRPGILSRFEARGTELVLKAADFRIGLPISFRKEKWSGRFEVFHASSHRGADFEPAAAPPPASYSREVVQALLAYEVSSRFRIYSGPSVLLRTHPAVGRVSFQAGTEWLPRFLSRPRLRAYLAEEVETRQESGWRMNLSVQPGILFVTSHGEPVARVAGWFYRGQSPFGQFFRERETKGGIQLTLELRHALGSLITRTR